MIELTSAKSIDTWFRRPPVMNLPEPYTSVDSTATVGKLMAMLELWETATPCEEEMAISNEALREVIVAMFMERGILYPSDVSMELGVDYDQVLEIIAALSNEGSIQVAE